MPGSDLTLHFVNVALLTALLAPLILWRYRRAVLNGMQADSGPLLPVAPAATRVRTGPPRRLDPAAWEATLRRRVFIAVLLAMVPASAGLAILRLYLSGLAPTPGRLLVQMGVIVGVVVPIYAVLMSVSLRRAVVLWLATMFATGAGLVVLSTVQRLVMERPPTVDQAPTIVDFFELAGLTLWLPTLAGLATGARRIRGVAPVVFAGLLVFGLGPYFGAQFTQALAATRAGSGLVVSLTGLDTGFVLLALPAGLLAWWRLTSLAGGYEAKRFSDAQLLARTWWLLIIVDIVATLIVVYDQPTAITITLAVGVAAYLLFPILLTLGLRWANPIDRRPAPRTLLVLRVFGYTARSEVLFDRIASRWRLFGPVTVIAGPDVTSRTVDPGDFLRFAAGNVAATFVNSRADLDRRLAALDTLPDPDGRYRVNDFCCRNTTWQATVVELIERADVVIMDVRGFTSQRQGCQFELRELAGRLAAEQVVLVVDSTTERAALAASMGQTAAGPAGPMRLLSVERGSVADTDAAFSALLGAAYPGGGAGTSPHVA